MLQKKTEKMRKQMAIISLKESSGSACPVNWSKPTVIDLEDSNDLKNQENVKKRPSINLDVPQIPQKFLQSLPDSKSSRKLDVPQIPQKVSQSPPDSKSCRKLLVIRLKDPYHVPLGNMKAERCTGAGPFDASPFVVPPAGLPTAGGMGCAPYENSKRDQAVVRI